MTQIRFRKCLKANLPTEAALGEPVVVFDTGELYIGQGQGQALKKVENRNTIVDENTGNQFKFWQGTQAQFDAIQDKDPYAVYFVL